MPNEDFPADDGFRTGDEPGYPEPPVESVQGFSQREASGMNQRQTIAEAQAAGSERARLLAVEESLRQRYGNSFGTEGKEGAVRIRQDQQRRRGQPSA